MKELWIQLWSDEDGNSMVEYVLIVALIALATVGVLTNNNGGLRLAEKNHYNTVAGKLNPANK